MRACYALLLASLVAPAVFAQNGGMDHDAMHADTTMHAGMHYVVHGRANDEARVSPNALTGQTIGTTNVLLAYGRPSVRERVIFGELVPWNEVWRTGANEATAFYVSDDVRVEGQPLAAGTYSLHTIPEADGDWTVIFNRAAQQWGSYEYDASQDALRVTVEADEADDTEMMTFMFEDVTERSAEVVLYWDEVRVPFTVEVTE